MRFGLTGIDLESRGLASYGWGGYRITFSDQASFSDSGSFSNFLAGLTMQRLYWEDRAQLLAILSVLHEYAHFEQDVTSGLGHWDFYFRRILVNQVLMDAKLQYVRADQPLGPFPIGKAQSLLESYSNFFCVDFAPQKRSQELELISRVLREELGVAVDRVAEVASFLTIQSLLELDAVCAVFQLVTKLKVSKEDEKELHDAAQFWNPQSMAALYAGPFDFVFDNVARLFGDRIGADTAIDASTARMIIDIVQFLCNLSLAHPSPDWLGRNNKNSDDFHPGVRMARMMRKLPSDKAPTGMIGIEDHLRATEGFEYPRISEIYQDWAEFLRGAYPTSVHAAIATMRIANCEIVSTGTLPRGEPGAVASKGPIYLSRDLAGFLNLDLPLLISRDGDRDHPMYLTGRALTDPNYMIDVRIVDRDLELVSFFLGQSDGFSCPFAESSLCEARVAACKRPYRNLRNIPNVASCLMRAFLQRLLPEAGLEASIAK